MHEAGLFYVGQNAVKVLLARSGWVRRMCRGGCLSPFVKSGLRSTWTAFWPPPLPLRFSARLCLAARG